MQRFVGHLRGQKNRDGLDQTLSTALVMSMCFAALPLLLTAALVWVLPSFLHLNASAAHTLRWIVALLGASVLVLFPNAVLGSYLLGLQRFDLYSGGVIATTTLRAALTVLALRQGYGPIGVATVALFTSTIWMAVSWRLLYAADPHLTVGWGRCSRTCGTTLLRFSVYAFLTSVGDYLRFYTDAVVIGRLLTVALITPFSIASRFMVYFKAGIVGLVSPLTPRMSMLEGMGKRSEVRTLYLQYTRITVLATLFVGALLLAHGKQFLDLWLKADASATYHVLVILSIGYIIELAQSPCASVLYAVGKHRWLGLWTIGEGGANLVLSIALARSLGVVGVALGTTIPMVATRVLVQPWYVARVLELRVSEYLRAGLVRPGLVILAWWIVRKVPAVPLVPGGVFQFLYALGWDAAVFSIAVVLLGCTSMERREMYRRGKSWICGRGATK
jgi:O-antigen/teichoic acid export membrane protein